MAEDVAVTLWGARTRRQSGLEPFVPVGGVVGDQIYDHPDAGLVEIGDESVKILQGPVLRGQVEVVGDIVAGVYLGRGVEGREPHGVDSKRG